METKIISIKVNEIYPHPDNPRKNLGDLEELAESIRKNGIMQNLTVIPGHKENGAWVESGYTTVIGHRRSAAAKLAGVEEVPCMVTEMTEKEQLTTMLEENMQRADLTPLEQAQGFQMMLDLGETEDTLAEKTGFSKTTIRHRLNIAKLDQKELKKKTEEGEYQLSITDLYALEKVKNIKKRNEILKQSYSSQDLVRRAADAERTEKREANMKIALGIFKKLGIEKAPEKTSSYDSDWMKVKEISLDNDPTNEIKYKGKEPVMWLEKWAGCLELGRKVKKEERKLSKYELEQKEREKRIKQIKGLMSKMRKDIADFLMDMADGKLQPVKVTEPVQKMLWDVLMEIGTGIYKSSLITFLGKKEYYKIEEEERKAIKEKIEKLSMWQQMIILVGIQDNTGMVSWRGSYQKESGESVKMIYECMEAFGFVLENEEHIKILDGSHELYTREQEK